MSMPEGAQKSEDGHWWWDGSQWQPVDQAHGGGHGGAAGHAGQAGQPAQHDHAAVLHQALTQQGVHVDASAVSDHEAVHRVVYQLHQWYSALDQSSRAVVDSLCGEGLTHLLADPEVAVVQEGHEFLNSLATTGHTLGSALEASGAALTQAHSATPQS
jgi:hypothetical protein